MLKMKHLVVMKHIEITGLIQYIKPFLFAFYRLSSPTRIDKRWDLFFLKMIFVNEFYLRNAVSL